ncbi:11951_t:CDS:2 [Funneliformis mosseae]|uniref:11951_t:CDS:1 n=1 Tax=Funneliformis mosseae TaxID=27381 RepID=A0A9N8ZAH2_FUNMO|nr:11951_t:CDS:2 [Funneliformis mosseae]
MSLDWGTFLFWCNIFLYWDNLLAWYNTFSAWRITSSTPKEDTEGIVGRDLLGEGIAQSIFEAVPVLEAVLDPEVLANDVVLTLIAFTLATPLRCSVNTTFFPKFSLSLVSALAYPSRTTSALATASLKALATLLCSRKALWKVYEKFYEKQRRSEVTDKLRRALFYVS